MNAPAAAALVGRAGTAAPWVSGFDAGVRNLDGTYTEVFTWSQPLLESLVADWGCAAPTDVSNFGGVQLWLKSPKTGGGYLYQPLDAIQDIDIFLPDGLGHRIHSDCIALTLDLVPATPESWVLIAASYNAETPKVMNADGDGNPLGPSVTLVTLAASKPPHFVAPGPVISAHWTTAIAGDHLLTITAMWSPPTTGGPCLGVKVTLQRPGQPDEDLGLIDQVGTGAQSLIQSRPTPASAETWTLRFLAYGANHAGDLANAVTVSQSVSPYPASTQVGVGTAAVWYGFDGAGNPTYGFSGTVTAPTDTQYQFCRIFALWAGQTIPMWMADVNSGSWRVGDGGNWKVPIDQAVTIQFCAVNLAGQINVTTPYTVALTVLAKGSVSSGSGTERAALVTGFSANVAFDRDEGGAWKYRFYGALTPPAADPRYQGGRLFYLADGATVPIPFLDVAVADTAYRSGHWTAPASETGIVYLLSMDANGRLNNYVNGVTPQASVTLTPTVGGAGMERAPKVTSLTAVVATDSSDTGGQRWNVSGAIAEPSDKSAYRGVRIVARPASGADIELAVLPLGTTAYQGVAQPMPKTSQGLTVLAFSLDAAGRSNAYQAGVTPAVSITVTPSATGTTDATRLDPATYATGEFTVSGNRLTFNGVPLSKATGFDASDFKTTGAVFAQNAVSADKITVGTALSIGGGSNKAGKFAVFDETGAYCGFIGKDVSSGGYGGTGYGGAWFKRILCGGAAPNSGVKFTVDVNGNVFIVNASISITAGANVVSLDTTNGLQVSSGTAAAAMFYNALQITNSSKSASLGVDQVAYVYGSKSMFLNSSGLTFYGTRTVSIGPDSGCLIPYLTVNGSGPSVPVIDGSGNVSTPSLSVAGRVAVNASGGDCPRFISQAGNPGTPTNELCVWWDGAALWLCYHYANGYWKTQMTGPF